jgi:hypothetical protein
MTGNSDGVRLDEGIKAMLAHVLFRFNAQTGVLRVAAMKSVSRWIMLPWVRLLTLPSCLV